MSQPNTQASRRGVMTASLGLAAAAVTLTGAAQAPHAADLPRSVTLASAPSRAPPA